MSWLTMPFILVVMTRQSWLNVACLVCSGIVVSWRRVPASQEEQVWRVFKILYVKIIILLFDSLDLKVRPYQINRWDRHGLFSGPPGRSWVPSPKFAFPIPVGHTLVIKPFGPLHIKLSKIIDFLPYELLRTLVSYLLIIRITFPLLHSRSKIYIELNFYSLFLKNRSNPKGVV